MHFCRTCHIDVKVLHLRPKAARPAKIDGSSYLTTIATIAIIIQLAELHDIQKASRHLPSAKSTVPSARKVQKTINTTIFTNDHIQTLKSRYKSSYSFL